LSEHEEEFGDSPYVFVSKQRGSSTGHLSVKSDNNGYWMRIIKRAGLYTDNAAKRITPHTMRKTLASWQALEGVDLLSISKSLGHSDIQTTARAYAHLSGDTVKAGVQKATDALQAAANHKDKNDLTAKEQLLTKVSGLTNEECEKVLNLICSKVNTDTLWKHV